ncbi:CAP domain-containing protein [Streptomyces sp. NBC_00576]|uniref:CAP domain-containing protein n=1 Tax=Streptomyces sp. NBC_00576 TaxID=2903665 RepID=UPI002E806E4A|nr:CAP domain-containing protein [Streptomyces sp. NBC_00576]WUB70808.1 CAP domain-containing protein [Streptomyces sp. NBC_00576]
MGRHRRSAAGSAATGRATGVTEPYDSDTDGYGSGHGPYDSPVPHTPHTAYNTLWEDASTTVGIAPYLNPEAHSDAYARSDAYLFAPDGAGTRAAVGGDGILDGRASGVTRRRRKKRSSMPIRTGLLGVSAAVALGTVAVATGVLPGGDKYSIGGGSSGDKVQAADTPTNDEIQQGGTSGNAAEDRDSGTSTSRDADRDTSAPSSPSPSSPSPSPSQSTASAAPTTPAPPKKSVVTPSEAPKATPTPTPTKSKQKQQSSAPITVSAQAAAEAEVLKLVNEERAKVGCSAVSANSALQDLAEAFSEDMAARDFFDHTDPDGLSPWDRADKAGITDLGGENIARGQADAAAVMEAWMNSPGHKANILNCDFKTLGVGVHLGSGGPWWTQDFGY